MTDESRRLGALIETGLLDTPPEPALDELTELAAEVCQTPISMISLVAENRQWFKSKVGVTITETPREHSFCAHALHGRDLFVVPDATADERFVHNPLVTGEPGIRFYAGAPLLTPEGFALGTICVIDRVNRQLSEIQKRMLYVLSRQVMAQIELRKRTNALVESEALLIKLFRSCPVAVTLKSWRNEVFLHVNHAFTNLVGWSREELIGRRLPDMRMLQPDSTDKKSENVISLRTKTGDMRRVLMDSTVILDAKEPQVITTFVDITELERAEEALRLNDDRIQRLRNLMAGSPTHESGIK